MKTKNDTINKKNLIFIDVTLLINKDAKLYLDYLQLCDKVVNFYFPKKTKPNKLNKIG